MSSIKFDQHQDGGFYKTLNRRVNDYFKEKGKSKHANGFMVFKSLFFISGMVLLYGLLVSDWFTFWQLVPIAILLGLFKAWTGVNIGHDAIHGAYSSSKTMNGILGRVFDFLGLNAFAWNVTHNIVHHTYTNIPEHDFDIEVSPKILRLSPQGPHAPQMRFQQYYAFFLYGISAFIRGFKQEYKNFFSRDFGDHITPAAPSKSEYFHLFFWRSFFYVVFLFVPMFMLSLPWWQIFALFCVTMFTEGLFLGIVFQLAHIVEKVDFPEPDETGLLSHAWSTHQMMTTANFATKNWMANFICGGLNTQVEHHLFPNICHIHYPNIAPIVAKTAAEFGLPYHQYPTFVEALKSHYMHLKALGEGIGLEEMELETVRA